MRYGVRSVSMDDIAQELGMSKKTIYQLFPSKAAIVEEVIRAHNEDEEGFCSEIESNCQHAIDELVQIVKRAIYLFQTVTHTLIHEVQKYYPEAWKILQHHTSTFLYEKVKENLQKGIQQGYYRKEIDIEVVARMRIAQINMGFDAKLFPIETFNYAEVQKQLMEIYMYGIVTPKGRALLQEYLDANDLTYTLQQKISHS